MVGWRSTDCSRGQLGAGVGLCTQSWMLPAGTASRHAPLHKEPPHTCVTLHKTKPCSRLPALLWLLVQPSRWLSPPGTSCPGGQHAQGQPSRPGEVSHGRYSFGMGSWKLFSMSSPHGCCRGQAVAQGAAGKASRVGAAVHSEQAGQQNLISYKPECKAPLPAVGARSCAATELPAGCLPCQGASISAGAPAARR